MEFADNKMTNSSLAYFGMCSFQFTTQKLIDSKF